MTLRGSFSTRMRGTASINIMQTRITRMPEGNSRISAHPASGPIVRASPFTPETNGFIVCTDQIGNGTEDDDYRREGEPGNPHDHSKLVTIILGGADSPDGLEITSRAVGPQFQAA
jgi:hypothetical protein